MTDKEIDCEDCSKGFVWTKAAQQSYQNQGFDPPKRCPGCRKARKEHRRQRKSSGIAADKAAFAGRRQVN